MEKDMKPRLVMKLQRKKQAEKENNVRYVSNFFPSVLNIITILLLVINTISSIFNYCSINIILTANSCDCFLKEELYTTA